VAINWNFKGVNVRLPGGGPNKVVKKTMDDENIRIITEGDLIECVENCLEFYRYKKLTKELVLEIGSDLSEEFKFWVEHSCFPIGTDLPHIKECIKLIAESFLGGEQYLSKPDQRLKEQP